MGLYSFLEHLDFSVNHPEIAYCFIKILLEYKKNSFTKIFLPRNIQIRHRSDPVKKKNLNSLYPHPRKIAGYRLRIRSVPNSADTANVTRRKEVMQP